MSKQTMVAGTKRKTDAPAPTSTKKHKAVHAPVPTNPTHALSSLSLDEVDFPRGGGTSLSQLELKAVRVEAFQQVDEEGVFAAPPNGTQTSPRKRKRQDDTHGRKKEHSGNRRIEKMNYKRLAEGTKVFCQVASVQPLGLVLSLPDQLVGHVPVTSISTQITERLESYDNEEKSNDDRAEDDAVLDLTEFFHCGQYVRAVVTSVRPVGSSASFIGRAGNNTDKTSGRVELSLMPDQVNAGVAKTDLQPGFVLTASVKSVEDHGYVLDLGLHQMSCFLPFLNVAGRGLHEGQLVDVVICAVAENGRSCTASTDAARLRTTLLAEVSNVSSIIPGALVDSLVTGLAPNGLNLQVLGYFEGTIDVSHLPDPSEGHGIRLGDKIKARVLYDIKSSAAPRFALSLASHIIQLDVKRTGAETKQSEKSTGPHQPPAIWESFPVGRVVTKATVARVESEYGLFVDLEQGVGGFVHISQVSDDHILALSSSSGQWKIGSAHTVRVIGHFNMDGILQLSMKPSILLQRFLQVDDVRVGDVVQGTVRKLTDSALFVSISGNVDGVIWPDHYADIQLRHPAKRFKEGGKVKCRILVVNSERQRIVLTAKKSLVESDLPIVSNFDDAKIGMITHGAICKISPRSLLVGFYSNLRALIPAQEIDETSRPEDYPIGKVVKVRILSIDRGASRMVASIKKVSSLSKIFSSSIDDIKIGDVAEGVIDDIHAENILLTLRPNQWKALLSLKNLANTRSCTVAQLRDSLHVGDEVQDLVVVSRNPDKGLVIVANQPKGRATFGTQGIRAVPITSIEVGQLVTGRVARHSVRGTYVKFGSQVHGTLHPTDVSDDYTHAAGFPAVDCTLTAVVIAVDKPKKHITLSTRASRMTLVSDVYVKDKEILGIGYLQIGDNIRGFIKNVAEHGLFVSIGRDVDARVQIKELFDEYVKDWKSRFEPNKLVAGRILSIDPERNRVEMTFRSGDLKRNNSSHVTLNDLEIGQEVEGRVRKVEDYGIFIDIQGSKTAGLCHRSELSDNGSADVTLALRSFQVGDTVKAKVLSIDTKKHRLSLGLKPSYFHDGNSHPKGIEDIINADDLRGDDAVVDETSVSEHGQDISDDKPISEDDESDSEYHDSQAQMDIDAVSPLTTSLQRGSAALSALGLSDGFRWTNAPEELLPASDEDGDDMDASRDCLSRQSKKRKTIEEDVTAAMQTKIPQSNMDFERVLLNSPNSSYLWIQYMSFQIQLSEVGKARHIGKRALASISFREEQEKLNVWTALLNIENAYGNDQSLELVFRDASRHNDSKTVHLRLARILDESNKPQKAEEQYKRTSKKFGKSSKVWTNFAEYYMGRGDLESARILLPRGLQSLEKRKHLKTISKFAQLEYKLGDPERGKMLFEGIIDSHPKRWDIWWIYIDMEAVQAELHSVRNLFDRVLSLKITNHKAKSFFKKWLELERRIGDEAGAEMVKDRARQWTQHMGALQ